jgi:hypothetical protein
MTFKTASAFRKAFAKDIEDMKADLKKFDKKEKAVEKVFGAIKCATARKLFQTDSHSYIEVSRFKGINTKAKFEYSVIPVLTDCGLKSVSEVFETPNSIGVFAKIAGVNVVVALNPYQNTLYIEATEKNESGKTRQKLFG